MRGRCCNETDARYPYYGGRGITLCDEWQDFEAFYSWAINNGYAKGLTIDRRDNNGGYSPDNCHWATVKVQANNKRNNHMIEYEGKVQTLAQWADEKNIAQNTLERRINYRKWSTRDALETPVYARR